MDDWEDGDVGLQRVLFESLVNSKRRVVDIDDESCYTIYLQKDRNFERDRRFGIGVDQHPQDKLRILNWRNNSMIAQWNKQQEEEGNPTSIVQANDVIEQVNGDDILGSSQRLGKALRNASDDDPTITIMMRRGANDDSAPINRRLPIDASPTKLYSSTWYNGIGGCRLGFFNWDATRDETLMRENTHAIDRLLLRVRDQQPTVLYLIFGGLLPPKFRDLETSDSLLQEANCLNRRFPAPLQRLLAKEQDATLLVAVLDNGRPREVEADLGIPAAIADRVDVHIVPFTIPRWPCTDILERFRLLRDEVCNYGGLFIALDEVKMIRETCYFQNFALYPILDLCSERPQSCLFLEWSSSINEGRGSIYTYIGGGEDRAKENFEHVLQWNGIGQCFEWGDDNVRKRRGKMFNFAVEDKMMVPIGLVQRQYRIDLTESFYR